LCGAGALGQRKDGRALQKIHVLMTRARDKLMFCVALGRWGKERTAEHFKKSTC